jgi:anaerobic carbon-monoxide dehydrogenase iron sulfur subunit
MPKALRTAGMKKCLGCFTCMLVCSAANKKDHSTFKSAIRVRTTGGMEGGFVSIVCRGCPDERACAENCPTGALKNRPGGGVLLEKEKCIGCRKCAEACIVGAVNFDEDEHTPIICKHCGICAQFCPHECIKLEEAGI